MERARSFGRVADAYERHRPVFPRALLVEGLQHAGIPEPQTIVDVGAGTGKLTRVLAGLAPRVIAVEPDDAMRARLTEVVPGVTAIAGTAERLPLEDGAADVVAAADAFHWFDGDAAVAEFARVLRLGGAAMIVRHERSWDDDPMWQTLTDLAAELSTETQRERVNAGPAELERSPAFGPVQRLESDGSWRMSQEDLLALIGTFSAVSTLPDKDRAAFLDRVREVLAGRGTKPFEVPYRVTLDVASVSAR